jgi:Cu+-exporting ATPase
MQQQSMKIIGMTCAACAQRIEKVTAKLSGVTKSSVNLASEKLTVEYDEQKVSAQEIQSAVRDAGYQAVPETSEKEITIPIGGMTCAACAQRIEKAVGKLDGVTSSTVNLATEKATIKYNPAIVRISQIKALITKLGYTPLESQSAAAVDEDKLRKQKAIRVLWTKFIVAAVFSMPLLYLAMGSMIWWLQFPIPAFLRPMQYPLTYALTQIALVIPVIIAGYRFYVVGFKAILQRSPNMDSLIAMGTSAAIIYSL